MSKKMLIDASHPEETRVVVVNGSRVEELDFESRNKRQLRGNVYLARVTRVEPSLQAAFVEYGGNRHGFLAFSEIHPDYYQIPYEDRIALIEAEEADNRAEDDEDEDEAETSGVKDTADEDSSEDDSAEDDSAEDDTDGSEDASDADDEEVAQEQAKTASTRRRRMSRRRYKIQEVIKRGQILLIQVVKEERGNKGAAMTTYLSLAGRYCVLMPNTPRGGGISRKIPNGADRKRLKSVVSEFEVPQGMGVIVRTAGAKRTKLEIKRDYDYLSRLWETTRDTTLKSIAPALIHEEGNLVKRSIRDLYNKDIDEVLVQGEEAYKTAKSFIKMLMPSHAKNVKAYKDKIPLFLRYSVERQIEESLDPTVQLKSGGYLVIHPTEALVSVDVNSGRSTKERNVERTALKTNLEAAEEVARQMRLRDLAGLIVIDFIDMDENRNNRAVEKRMKEALSRDRARVQNSRISQFGLMEISRQRRRRSLLEGSTAHCEHCAGVGRKRTMESSALCAIRAVEEIGVRGKAKRIRLKVAPDVALYLFNEKRGLLQSVEDELDVFTELVGDETLIRPHYEIEVLETAEKGHKDPLVEIEKELKKADQQAARDADKARKVGKKSQKAETQKSESQGSEEDNIKSGADEDDTDSREGNKRRRRRGRRGGRGRKSEDATAHEDALDVIEPSADEARNSDDDGAPKRGRKRKPKAKKDETAKKQADSSRDDVAGEVSDKVSGEDAPVRSTARRKAPTRKPKTDEVPKAKSKKGETTKAETSESQDDSPAESGTAEKAPVRSTARRKAPTRKPAPEAETAKGEADKSASQTKAPAKKTSAKKTPAKKTSAKKATAKKAPTKKVESQASSEEKPARTKKAPTRKKATPKKKPEAADPAAAAKPEAGPEAAARPASDEAAPKSTARRKAPARKPQPKTAAAKPAKAKPAEKSEAAPAKTESETPKSEAPAKSTARRKAPAGKPTAGETAAPDHSADSADMADAKQDKKKGWLFGLKKK